MARKIHARRYAQAVFEIARQNEQLDKWQADLSKVAELVGDADVVDILESPRLGFEYKAGLLKERLPDVSSMALNLVHLLIARDKLNIAGEIASEYNKLLNSYRGIEPAHVITAVPLADNEKQKLIEQLKSMTGKEIVLKSEVDPSLIGGVVVRVGDKLIDGSTRSRLIALKKELAGAQG